MSSPVPRLVLASASPARLRLLELAGLRPEVIVSGVDESNDVPDEPHEHVLVLARRKARAVAAGLPAGALVVGCDSMLDVDGTAQGKPGCAEQATARWQLLAGRTAVLRTGHCVIDTASGREASAVAATTVRFGRPTPSEIAAYVASGEPLEVAGGFTLDGRSAPFIDGVDGDPGNVIGLSLPLLRTLLSDLGVDLVALWA